MVYNKLNGGEWKQNGSSKAVKFQRSAGGHTGLELDSGARFYFFLFSGKGAHDGMFLGESFNTLDPAKRLIIPMRFREGLGGEIVLLKAPDPCLYLYSTARFEALLDQFDSLPDTGMNEQRIRYFYSRATEVSVDRTGRVVLPQDWLAYAGITTDVALLGHRNRVELWDAETYRQFLREAEETPDAMRLPVRL